MKHLNLGGIQHDTKLPRDDLIGAALIDALPDEKKQALDAEGPLGPTARSVRLMGLMQLQQYRATLQANAIAQGDYSTWCDYFPKKKEYPAHGDIQRLRDAETLGLPSGTIATAELFFGSTVFFFLRRRGILDAALVGVPDDPRMDRACLARILLYGADYSRVPKTAGDMTRVITARRGGYFERRRFRRDDPYGIFA